MECEEHNSRCLAYKDALKSEKEKHNAAKERLRLLITEVNTLREELRTNKENATAQKSLTSQLLAYQILHKKDMDGKKALTDELAKVKAEFSFQKKRDDARIRELTEEVRRRPNSGCKVDGWVNSEAPQSGSDELRNKTQQLETENEKLKLRNEAMSGEYKRLKEDMDETVSQLIV